MNVAAIIPARMGSSRFPGKPLAPICGLPMILHCLHRTAMATSLKYTAVATCDEEIVETVRAAGGMAIMTSNRHERASDRTAEAVAKLEAETGVALDVVVMVQGDEPLVTPEMIEASLLPFREDPEVKVVNLVADLETLAEADDPNEVKVVHDLRHRALYFSREAIPSTRKGGSFQARRQVCVIPFERRFLDRYTQLEPTPLEVAESVDMMRVLEHGFTVHLAESPSPSLSVDTLEDLQSVELRMEKDPLLPRYHRPQPEESAHASI